ncbi:uncharacterized protein EV154DRAFT_514478 [Mucor mucedo]|uniref:uncharacterized protein n=1 Tax=Mucor mucedo TaxID=29922 RepID=UPI00221E9172|nr:uncharacterized protein EV154DRAFT_514478 [Mucor mucedo]KAI7889509.1 hypothetical protein EV154DRAFT_514478 [Mucor mucedo]
MSEERPSVEPEQIKQLLQAKNNKPQHHTKYDYYKSETLESEINEFVSYSEVRIDLKQYEEEYNETFPSWKESTLQEKKSIIQQATDYLDLLEEDKRIFAAKSLVYISLGSYGEFMGEQRKSNHITSMEENNRLLYDADIISTLKKTLDYGCNQLEKLSITCQTDLVEAYCKEIDIYLTILFMIFEFNKDRSLEEYQLPEFLFDLVVRLKEHFTKTFPLKKLMSTLFKILSITLGELNGSYADIKSDIRTVCDLPIITDKASTVKCTPEDLYTFYHQSCERYPSFTPTTPPKKIANPLTVTASTQLSKAMGIYKASKHIDLPYQTLFPSKNQPAPHTVMNKTRPVEVTNVLPFTAGSNEMSPKSLVEASSVWMEHLYISVANYQIIHERENAIHRWQKWSKKDAEFTDEWKALIYDQLEGDKRQKMNRIEQLYTSIVPNFQSIVVVLLKLLLSTVSIGKDKEAEILEDINITRNRETISKAVSGILLLLLKWFKTSHVLKFEYLSQILIDSGCMLLILKLLGLQEVALLASKRTDDDSQSFFGYVQRVNNDITNIFEDVEDEEEEETYTNERNLCWSINLLRILQMLTKKKTHRVLLLVQYKSSAILKRLLKVGHPVMDLYVLKNLKNQIPYMGRKWRSSNMKTISAIYARCLTSLNDDWLSSPEGNSDMEEGAMKEVNLRLISRLYNGQRYLPDILPKMDEVYGPDSTLFYPNKNTTNNNYEQQQQQQQQQKRHLPEYNLNAVIVDDVDLDPNFKEDYRNWLENTIYSTTDDEDDDESESNPEHTWSIGTPLPDIIPTPITADDLAREINKLYMEELQREFIEKQQKLEVKEDETDGWDKPTIVKNPWGDIDFENTGETKTKEVPFDDDDDDPDEIEPEVDPLQGINWGSLTEEELTQRLNLVQEKTVQRWLNVDMDDPRYLKVLNTFEGEVLEDDDGWPI